MNDRPHVLSRQDCIASKVIAKSSATASAKQRIAIQRKLQGMEQLLERQCCIRSYHVYKEVWEAGFGEMLTCKSAPDDASDRYAVAVKKEGITVGHLPRN